MATFRITLVKASPYKTEPAELWANSYYLSGTEPSDATEWVALAEAIWGIEGSFIQVEDVRTYLTHGYGYAPGSDIASWSGDFTSGGSSSGIAPTGTGFTNTHGIPTPIDNCALIRMECGISSHTGKPRYVMKYLHDVFCDSTNLNGSLPLSSEGTANLALLISGALPGSAQVCAPDGTLCTNATMRPYLTTHQLKRRGKRPRRGA
jgi:hypothetical protein